MAGVTIDSYAWAGGREAMLRFSPDTGPATGPVVIAALPLFEEANRTRAAMVDVLRRLAARGIAGALPDLPGTGESLVETRNATLDDWRTAFAAAAASLPNRVYAVTWRGGALVDPEAAVAARWHLAPLAGADAVRELRRVRTAGGGADYAGNRLSDAMIARLDAATLAPARTVRLDTDPRPADARLAGPPLWRAAEPGVDAAFQAAIADDIAAWIAECEG